MKTKYVSREDVDVDEHDPHKYVAEASTLSIRPGAWPLLINTRMGNGQPFILTHHHVHDGDIMWTIYRQGNGCLVLKVFND